MKNIFASVQARNLDALPEKATSNQAARGRMPRRRIVIGALILLAVLATASGIYLYRAKQQEATSQVAVSALQTAVARRGSLTVSASAAGQVVTSGEVSLGFDEAGTLSELLVKVGDEVTTGQVLARLEIDQSAEDIALALAEAQLNLLTAQQALDDLTASSQLDAAEAMMAVETAQQELDELQNPALRQAQASQAVAEAQAEVNSALSIYNGTRSTADAATIAKAKAELTIASANYQEAKDRYDDYAGKPDTSLEKANETLKFNAALAAYNTALRYYNAVTGTGSELDLAQTAADLAAAQAKLAQAQREAERIAGGATPGEIALAEANLAVAQAKYETLKDGPDPAEVTRLEAELASAKAKLEVVQETQPVLELTAPMDGTILAINASVGEELESGAIVTMADLTQPLLQVYLDETDVDKAIVAYEAEVIFDSLPDETFTGHIIEVNPSLQSVSGVSAVMVKVLLDGDSFSKPQMLPVGSNASVEVIGGRTENAVLVPVEAVREISPGEYAVFVLENGEPRLRLVTVGLMDYTYAEIISGVEAGETVTTGLIETAAGAVQE
jgi:RND family efflux transporter MFP subunit